MSRIAAAPANAVITRPGTLSPRLFLVFSSFFVGHGFPLERLGDAVALTRPRPHGYLTRQRLSCVVSSSISSAVVMAFALPRRLAGG